jgi:hypothetical protein
MPRKRQFSSRAARSVEPEPQNGSRTTSPGFKKDSTKGVKTLTGF